MLLDSGANVNAAGDIGWTSLMLASKKGCSQIVQVTHLWEGILELLSCIAMPTLDLWCSYPAFVVYSCEDAVGCWGWVGVSTQWGVDGLDVCCTVRSLEGLKGNKTDGKPRFKSTSGLFLPHCSASDSWCSHPMHVVCFGKDATGCWRCCGGYK